MQHTQEQVTANVRNLFLKDTLDERYYTFCKGRGGEERIIFYTSTSFMRARNLLLISGKHIYTSIIVKPEQNFILLNHEE